MGSSPSDEATFSAFFYGTLMAPEVFFSVCYRHNKPPPEVFRQYAFRPAVLSGYTRHRVRNAAYPGIVPDAAVGAAVRGVVCTGLTAANLRSLDYFEGDDYVRRTVEVTLEGQSTHDAPDGPDGPDSHGQRVVSVLVYVFKDPACLEPVEWDFDEFRREKLKFWAEADYIFADCDPDRPATVEG